MGARDDLTGGSFRCALPRVPLLTRSPSPTTAHDGIVAATKRPDREPDSRAVRLAADPDGGRLNFDQWRTAPLVPGVVEAAPLTNSVDPRWRKPGNLK